jgi:hypothetical protein
MAHKKKLTDSELELFIQGMATASITHDEVISRMLQSINDVIGLYMENDLGRNDEKVRELELMYDAIRHLGSSMSDAYFEKLDEVKSGEVELT